MSSSIQKHTQSKAIFLFGVFIFIFQFTAQAQDWKSEAWSRIDSIRKNEITVNVTSASGIPIENATVKIKLNRHSFIFGAAVRSLVFHSSPYKAKYKDLYLEYFNSSEMEIGMKPQARDGYWERNADQVWPWFIENDFIMRGHNLVWEGEDWLPDNAKDVYRMTNISDKEKGDSLLKILDDHLYHAIPKWDVDWWDVINEPVVNNIVNNLLPDYNTFTHWFKLADSLRTVFDKDFKLVLNENQVISGNAKWAESRIPDFQAIIDDMLAEGAPIEILGFQGRIQYGMLSPETMYQRLLTFDKYDLPYQVTEFEIRDSDWYNYTDSELKQLTEETMTIYFSHPKVEGFWHWTFVDDKDGTMPWALFNYNGTPTPTGEKWIELMEGKFGTDTTLTINETGNYMVRGFKGEYDIEISYLDSTIKRSLTLDEDTLISICIPHDLYYNLSGLKEGAAYSLSESINIELSAFSDKGDITSISLFMNEDSLGESFDSTLSMNYTPTSSEAGWNEFTVKIQDENSNELEHSSNVYFGDTLPVIDFISLPADTIFIGSTGNNLSFSAHGTYGNIESVYVSYAGSEFSLPDTSTIHEFNFDDLSPGNYEFVIEVTDDKGHQISETVFFSVVLAANILPSIEITSPQDSVQVQVGSNILLSINASDSDGTISQVDVFLNNSLSHTFLASPYALYLGSLSIGEHTIIAVAIDDREGSARDTVVFSVQDSTTSLRVLLNPSTFNIYPNPTSNTLHFSMVCDYEIYTILGRRILEGKEASNVDVSSLKNGLYFIKTNHGVAKLKKV